MSENLADLEQLSAAAAAVDSMAEAGADLPVAAAPDAQADSAGEVAALLSVVAGMLSPLFPSLPGIYDQATCRKLGDAAAPVLEKYDVSVGGVFERWGAEITLAAVALPVAIATAQAIKSDLSARSARHKKLDDDGGNKQQDQDQAPAGVYRLGGAG